MSKNGVAALLERAAKGKRGPIAKRYPATTWASVLEDIKAIAASIKDGNPAPTYSMVVEYLRTEYGVEMGRHTVREYLDKAINNQPLE